MADTPLFVLLAQLAGVDGAAPIKDTVWERTIGDDWFVAINGHAAPRACSRGKPEIPPFHAYVEFHGLPAGIFHPYGGEFVAHSNANEELFAAAIERALEAA